MLGYKDSAKQNPDVGHVNKLKSKKSLEKKGPEVGQMFVNWLSVTSAVSAGSVYCCSTVPDISVQQNRSRSKSAQVRIGGGQNRRRSESAEVRIGGGQNRRRSESAPKKKRTNFAVFGLNQK